MICVIYSQLRPVAPCGFCQFLRGGAGQGLLFAGRGSLFFRGAGRGGVVRASLLYNKIRRPNFHISLSPLIHYHSCYSRNLTKFKEMGLSFCFFHSANLHKSTLFMQVNLSTLFMWSYNSMQLMHSNITILKTLQITDEGGGGGWGGGLGKPFATKLDFFFTHCVNGPWPRPPWVLHDHVAAFSEKLLKRA